jgi:hypothetical protein
MPEGIIRMGKYDGTVRIDTRMDTGGFNKGIGKIGTAMRGIGAVLGKIAIGAALAFGVVLFILASIVRGLISLAKVMFDVGKDTGKYAAKVEELKSSFASLKMAIADAFRPLILAALPWIQQVVSWVQALLSLVAQVTAGLTGQSGYWKTTATAASGAADATKEVAENTKKAGEAAEGALAAFDDLNVLQIAKEQDTAAGGENAAGTSQEWVPLGEKALGIVDKIKAAFESIKLFFEPLLEPLGRIWDAFKRIWEQIKIAAGAIWEDLTPAFEWFRDNVLVPILDALATLFEKIATWAEENPEHMKGIIAAFMLLALAVLLVISPVAQVIAIVLVLMTIIGLLIKYWPEISAAAKRALDAVVLFFDNAWKWIKNAFDQFIKYWKEGFDASITWIKKAFELFVKFWKDGFDATVKFILDIFKAMGNFILQTIDGIRNGIANFKNAVFGYFRNLYNDVTALWGRIKDWFTNTVINPLVKAWSTATGSIKQFFVSAFNGIKNTVKNVMNSIIDFINGMIRGAVSGINGLIGMINLMPGINIGYVNAPPQIPRLASGAVIPPNAAFLAMLGDQRHGTNIEAPEELIRQIVREEGGGGKEVTINFAGSLGALVRELKPYIDKENNRIGRSLVKGSIS